jgi:hypothetical protein
MSRQTGYFGRPSENGQSGRFTHVHFTKDGECLCGYKPHSSMSFQWNCHEWNLSYVECDKCRKLAIKRLPKELKKELDKRLAKLL